MSAVLSVCALILVSGVAGRSEARPHATLLTALPLFWGEGDARDVLAGRAARSPTLKAIDADVDIRAIDVLSDEALARDVAILAQPRRLTPRELVTFDAWVRRGGRALIFADPDLLWPSRYPAGDTRRAPPVTLLDPLFAHWKIALGDADHDVRIVTADGARIAVASAGRWTGPKSCAASAPEMLDCRIGKGRVILVGDADLLDARLWTQEGTDTPAWIAGRTRDLARGEAELSPPKALLFAAPMVVTTVIGLSAWHKRRKAKNRRRTFQ